ncbi:GAF and ANTAR domain-containing protein [Kribbella hippodromi]|uniref:GAF and ANTAR domain-containing protein n=1 Tax=Kribbella hippodromi TaxID=434347 RepID=UPI0031D4AFC1
MELTVPQTPSVGSAQLFAEFAVQLHDVPGMEKKIEKVVRFARQVAGCTYAGAVLAGPVVGAVTDAVVQKLCEWELDADAGPLLDALAGGHTVYVPDVGAATDWPKWRTEAVSFDLGSVLHVPMVARAQVQGVLSLYHLEPAGLSDTEAQQSAHILARYAAVAIASSRRLEELDRVVDARKLIGQAMGILMERFAIDADAAFAILRRHSKGTGTTMSQVAQQVIVTRHVPSATARQSAADPA